MFFTCSFILVFNFLCPTYDASQSFFFLWLPDGNAVTHTGSGMEADDVGLALFNGPYPLKPSRVSGAGVTRAGRDLGHLHVPHDPPSVAGRC